MKKLHFQLLTRLAIIASLAMSIWQAIARANRLYNPNWIYDGMRLAIPCSSGEPVPGAHPAGYASSLYHYKVIAPAGWTVRVNTSM